MKRVKVFSLLLALLTLLCCTMVGCQKDNPSQSNLTSSGKDHVCQHACEVCGGCTSTCIYPTCSNNRCSCNVQSCEHEYALWSIEKLPTNGTLGRATSLCTKCQEVIVMDLPILGDSEYYSCSAGGIGSEDGFGKLVYTYNDTVNNINFTTTVSNYPENSVEFKKECEEMTMIKGAKSAENDTASGGRYVGWMSGATQVGNGFTWSFTASEDSKALLIICVGLRNKDVPLNSTYSFTIQYGTGLATDVPVDDEFVFPKVTSDLYDWIEMEIVVLDLKQGTNTLTFIHDTDLTGINFDYFKLISTATIIDGVEEVVATGNGFEGEYIETA